MVDKKTSLAEVSHFDKELEKTLSIAILADYSPNTHFVSAHKTALGDIDKSLTSVYCSSKTHDFSDVPGLLLYYGGSPNSWRDSPECVWRVDSHEVGRCAREAVIIIDANTGRRKQIKLSHGDKPRGVVIDLPLCNFLYGGWPSPVLCNYINMWFKWYYQITEGTYSSILWHS